MLVVCDGDYDTATCQTGDFDPFDQLVREMIDQNVTKLWVMRQMAHILTECGFELAKRRGHFYVAEGNVGSFNTEIDRGAVRLVERSGFFAQSAEALKAEAQSRLKAVTFFG
ncbi:MAG: hypothetical protein WBV78_02140, partial [Roseobacter sp.]